MRKAKNIFANIDVVTIVLYMILVFFGWINIYASQYNDDTEFALDFTNRYGKQMYFIAISLFCGFLTLIIDWNLYYSLSYILYGLIITTLITVLIIGGVTWGATSWFEIGGLKFQPSEFAKFATALALAKFFNMQHAKKKNFKTKIYSYIIILSPCLLVILQNDLGTALIFSAFILVLYREGLSINILFLILITGILFILSLLINQEILIYIFSIIAIISLFIFRFNKKDIVTISVSWIVPVLFISGINYFVYEILKPHHSKRIDILLGKEFDPYGAG